MKPIKLQIQRLKRFSERWAQYFTMQRILIDEGSSIETEADLCTYMYNKFGPGRYRILAWQKGYKYFWVYWIGDLFPNGFVRDKRKDTYMEKLKLEHKHSQSYEEREMIENEMETAKEFDKETKQKRRGPLGLIKSTPGVLHSYSSF